jgi:dipeptidyl aminopeptidase/acylaminoacyl peptidase
MQTAGVVLGLLFAVSAAYGEKAEPIVRAQFDPRTPTPASPATPDPYADLSIERLAVRAYGGGEVAVDQVLARAAGFTRYLIHYPSDGLTIYGFMDVPTSAPKNGAGYPVIVAIHGYIAPGLYETLDYTTRYADALARAGYLVLHPNLRSYRPSDSGPNLLRVGFAIDVLNLVAIVRAHAGQPGPLQRADAAALGLWGHSMGGGIAIRAMTVDQGIRAVVLYGSMSGDEKQNFEAIQRWSNRQRGHEEANLPASIYERVSPMYFYQRIRAAVSIHHGLADMNVPPAWSADLCARLQALRKSVECFTYAGQPHTFRGAGDQLFMQRMIAFFDAHLRTG